MKKNTTTIIVLILLALGIYFIFNNSSKDTEVSDDNDKKSATTTVEDNGLSDAEKINKPESVIGKSVLGNDITAYHFGNGNRELLFIGGIHGGYEWNTVLVAYELMDYLKANPNKVPANLKVTIIPVLNPDGLFKTIGKTGRFSRADVPASQDLQVSGRYNKSGVDLNRNFDCDWKSIATWQKTTVSGGSKPFSEPESQAIKSYIDSNSITATLVWYSSAGGVFASSCHDGVLPETRTITNVYSKASGYPAYEDFDFYEITGDMVNWFARQEIPAISVLLSTHEDVEWEKNKAGINALLEHYSK